MARAVSATLKPDANVRCKRDVESSQEAGVRIGEVAAKAGVSVRALRYYEQQDLLHSTRIRVASASIRPVPSNGSGLSNISTPWLAQQNPPRGAAVRRLR